MYDWQATFALCVCVCFFFQFSSYVCNTTKYFMLLCHYPNINHPIYPERCTVDMLPIPSEWSIFSPPDSPSVVESAEDRIGRLVNEHISNKTVCRYTDLMNR